MSVSTPARRVSGRKRTGIMMIIGCRMLMPSIEEVNIITLLRVIIDNQLSITESLTSL